MDDLANITIFKQFLSGDDDAFETFYNNFFKILVFDCLRSLTKGKRQEAQNLAQETFLKVFEYRDKYHNESIEITNIRSWLFFKAKNIWLNDLKKLKRRAALRARNYDPHLDLIVLQDHSEKQVLFFLESLKDERDQTILLLDYQGYDTTYIANLFDKSNQWVSNRKHRARKKLQKRFGLTKKSNI